MRHITLIQKDEDRYYISVGKYAANVFLHDSGVWDIHYLQLITTNVDAMTLEALCIATRDNLNQ